MSIIFKIQYNLGHGPTNLKFMKTSLQQQIQCNQNEEM